MDKRFSTWVMEMASLLEPKEVVVCDGSLEEFDRIANQMVQSDRLVALDPQKRPHSFLARSDPKDVARVEERTFICTKEAQDAGPTNRWRDPEEMKQTLTPLFRGTMRGRTLYVIPFLMGPPGSPYAKRGVQLTDSPYVVLNMRLMTRMGVQNWGKGDETSTNFVRGLHSVGVPLIEGTEDVPWPCRSDPYICHFPESLEIWSFGSGYGGNALLGKKCLALRLGSWMGKQEGWLAEHMLIASLTSPTQEKKYFAAAFPSMCGKTNLAMLTPSLPGWKVETVGDDIAWLHVGADGRLWAMNPEAGFFGVAPGTSWQSNPHAMEMLRKDTIFTNVALTPDQDVWWEGMTKEPPVGLIDWRGDPWHRGKGTLASHPNARFTVSVQRCPALDPQWENLRGVPLDFILFGGRRSSVLPLVCEAKNWVSGVFFGASMTSETTAAASGAVGQLRHDPFAMLPFCGYHMGDYFQHWLDIGKKLRYPPRIYSVNWFRKAKEGSYLWPGFGENLRVLQWIFERQNGKQPAQSTAIGDMPFPEDLGLQEEQKTLLQMDPEEWIQELAERKHYFSLFKERFPEALWQEFIYVNEALHGLSG